MTPKSILMTGLKVGDLFTPIVSGKGRESFTVLEMKLKQVICTKTIDVELVHNKKPEICKKNIKGYCYLLKRN